MKLVGFLVLFVLVISGAYYALSGVQTSAPTATTTIDQTAAAKASVAPGKNKRTQPPTGTPTPPVATTTPATSTPPLATSTALRWGAYLGTGAPTLSGFATEVGASPDIVATFIGWPDLPDSSLNTTCSQGKTLFIYWENYGYSLDNIIAGRNDAYIASFSQALAQYHCPIMLSIFHEMNGNWDEWDGTVGTNSPAKIITAWQRIHSIVTASNVQWAWVINSNSVPDTIANAAQNYYPGSAYVDVIGVDGFNFGSPWQAFGQIFDAPVTLVQQFGKPVYISSFASVAGSGKATWINDFAAHIKTYANVVGWVWFDENQGGSNNFLIDSDPTSLAAFEAVVR